MVTTSTAPSAVAAALIGPAADKSRHWTIADLEGVAQPWDDTRYEIIDGELFVSTQPSLRHQYATQQVQLSLGSWNLNTGLGVVLPAPGLIFADDDNAAPDVVWLSWERLRAVAHEDGKLHGPPELIVEVLSPGAVNERRDRAAKLALYSRRGVDEYWIVDHLEERVAIHRRHADDPGALRLMADLGHADWLESPLLPGFRVRVGELFFRQPA
jgi:Uma2 family endonuclease